MVIWICGPSGAGKTTIGRALRDYLRPRLPALFLLDGDEFRAAMGNDLGYSAAERRENGLRIARTCKLLESQGLTVICCAATIHEDVQAYNFENLGEYYQVAVDISMETLRQRDTKDIYRRASTGTMVDVLGVDMKFDVPETRHMTLNNDQNRASFEDVVLDILRHIGLDESTTPDVQLPPSPELQEAPTT